MESGSKNAAFSYFPAMLVKLNLMKKFHDEKKLQGIR